MKTCFSERKLMKQFGNPLPFLREPPFQLTLLSVFSMTLLFVQVIKTRNPSLIVRGERFESIK